ncbi:MAG: hypothetical protein JXR49_12020 [Acidobacteria bacterium]|nr:hypothetical protein [Acidobacteriota bacterium]
MSMIKNKLYLHCGAHKTATTSLQIFFLENIKFLENHNIKYISIEDINNQNLFSFLHGKNNIQLSEVENHQTFFKNIIRESNTSSFLISHESILSFAGDPTKGRIYPTFEKGLERLHLINIFDEISFFFCFREPSEFLHSIYLQNLCTTYSGPFDLYLQKVDFMNLSWLFIPDAFENLWKDSNVTWQLFEIINSRGSEYFLKSFFDWLEIPFSDEFKLPVSNESLSIVAANMLSASGLTRKNMCSDTRKSLRRFLKSHFPASKYGKANYLNENICGDIQNALEKDNRKLFKRLFAPDDIKLWGYS